MNQPEPEKLVIDDREYLIANLTPDQQYLYRQMKNIVIKQDNLQLEMDVAKAARTYLEAAMRQSLGLGLPGHEPPSDQNSEVE